MIENIAVPTFGLFHLQQLCRNFIIVQLCNVLQSVSFLSSSVTLKYGFYNIALNSIVPLSKFFLRAMNIFWMNIGWKDGRKDESNVNGSQF